MDYSGVLLGTKKIKVHTKIKNLIAGEGYKKKKKIVSIKRPLYITVADSSVDLERSYGYFHVCKSLCTIVFLPFFVPYKPLYSNDSFVYSL